MDTASQDERIAAQAKQLAPGDTVSFGAYAQEGIPGGEEEIEWNVLAIKDGRALLLSRYVLELRCQHEDKYARTNWDASQIRTWLNSTFFNEAFTSGQRAAICSSTISNKAAEISETCHFDNRDTVDRVFLLSWKDAFERYFTSDADRRAVCTAAVACRGPNTLEGSCSWWLRTNESGDRYAAVGEDGKLKSVSALSKAGIRPALWLDLSAFSTETAKASSP